jgi:hypothetical protein
MTREPGKAIRQMEYFTILAEVVLQIRVWIHEAFGIEYKCMKCYELLPDYFYRRRAIHARVSNCFGLTKFGEGTGTYCFSICLCFLNNFSETLLVI